MAKWAWAVLSVMALSGCTRVIDSPHPVASPPIGPISTLQVSDLLSDDVADRDGNVFVTVEPERCSGLAREVDPPFIAEHHPAATDGGHWVTDDGPVYVEEIVAVFPSDFNAGAALTQARAAIDSCRGSTLSVTTMRGRTYVFDVSPPAPSDPATTMLWSLRASDWICDNAFVAAHNSAIEITACGATGGFDIASAAGQALERIAKLANTTA